MDLTLETKSDIANPEAFSVFKEGRNWGLEAQATRASFIVDAEAYYSTFAELAEKAERSIWIASWDIDGRIPLSRHSRKTLRPFLYDLLERKPYLHIYILNWDYNFFLWGGREALAQYTGIWNRHPRLHFHWDNRHPFWASHHQKIVVIDQQIAFCGGLDLADERWDTRGHYPSDNRRTNMDQKRYEPFHDVMMMLEGPAAIALQTIVEDRWAAVGRTVHPPSPSESSESYWPPTKKVDLEDVSIRIARTQPAYQGAPGVYEVAFLYEDAIASAKKLIYVENQYFTSNRVAAAIARRLREEDGPEIVLVLPKRCSGILEEATLGITRWRLIRRLKRHDLHNRLTVCYPYIRGLFKRHYLKVHSKLMIVDDSFIQVGSANLSNRSMSYDTECNVAFEAGDRADLQKAIRAFRMRLLSEHLQTPAETLEALFEQAGSLTQLIRNITHSQRRLIPFLGRVSPYLDKIIPKSWLVNLRRLI